MSKHTPGPWKMYSDSLTVHADCGGMEYNPTNIVASVSGVGSLEMEKANARLIAAAPDLFKALELFIEIGRTTSIDRETMMSFGPAYDAAFRAIAKASSGE